MIRGPAGRRNPTVGLLICLAVVLGGGVGVGGNNVHQERYIDESLATELQFQVWSPKDISPAPPKGISQARMAARSHSAILCAQRLLWQSFAPTVQDRIRTAGPNLWSVALTSLVALPCSICATRVRLSVDGSPARRPG
jgi:hypothetical protein